jgi:hypothetical protein
VTHPVFPGLDGLMERELAKFEAEHPRSADLTRRAKDSLLGGVPMHWMVRWAGGFPVFASRPTALASRTWTTMSTSTSAWATRAR